MIGGIRGLKALKQQRAELQKTVEQLVIATKVPDEQEVSKFEKFGPKPRIQDANDEEETKD